MLPQNGFIASITCQQLSAPSDKGSVIKVAPNKKIMYHNAMK